MRRRLKRDSGDAFRPRPAQSDDPMSQETNDRDWNERGQSVWLGLERQGMAITSDHLLSLQEVCERRGTWQRHHQVSPCTSSSHLCWADVRGRISTASKFSQPQGPLGDQLARIYCTQRERERETEREKVRSLVLNVGHSPSPSPFLRKPRNATDEGDPFDDRKVHRNALLRASTHFPE